LERGSASTLSRSHAATLARAADLWQQFLAANDWDTGNRKDWEFCLRAWRDGECFLRLFRQPAWPPRIHFIDPEQIAPDPATGLPTGGIATAPGNVEVPVAYYVREWESESVGALSHPDSLTLSRVPADRILHTKIGVDANVKRGVSLLLPVLDALKRFQGWLDVELIQRKVASSIVLVRKHQQNYPGGVTSFADSLKTGSSTLDGQSVRRLKLQPGSIIDAQGFDLEFLSPDTHFADASLLGRMILLAIAAGTGLPEYMLTADASNANYASTQVAERPVLRHFATWQTFFIGQWQKLFRMVLGEAVQLGLLSLEEVQNVTLQITPPSLAVRDRVQEAQADAIYFDRGALSARELARRDDADPDLMQRERNQESGIRN
jgi:capsid protein